MDPPNPSRFAAATQMDKDWTPPNPSRFGAALAKGQGLHPPPNPSRSGAAARWTRIGSPNPCERTRIGPPQPWSGSCKRTRVAPPKPFTIWSGSQMDKDLLPPPTLHDLERLLQKDIKDWTPQPFTIWSGSQMDKDWTPQPFTTWRVFLSRKLTADFLLPNSEILLIICAIYNRLSADLQPHRKLTISSGTRQDHLIESPNENPPAQPLRKPNPERDRLTESTHALLFVSSKLPPAQPRSQKAHCFTRHSPA